MNDTQMLTIALAAVPTMLTVLSGILLNNARLSDVNSRPRRGRARRSPEAPGGSLAVTPS